MRRKADKRAYIFVLGAFLVAGLALPMAALGAGDDCPPPSEGVFEDPGYVENDSPPPGSGGSGGDGGGTGETASEDGGTFGSLGGLNSSQLTVAALAVVGVFVGAAYLIMVGRMDEDEE